MNFRISHFILYGWTIRLTFLACGRALTTTTKGKLLKAGGNGRSEDFAIGKFQNIFITGDLHSYFNHGSLNANQEIWFINVKRDKEDMRR